MLKTALYICDALKINSQLPFAYFGLGKIYQNLKKTEEAIEEYTNCIKYDSENYKAHFQIGLIFYMKSELIMARQMFEHCLKIEPDYVLGKFY